MRLVGLIFFCLGILFEVLAGAPELKSFLPMAARPGSTNTVTFSGSFDPWPSKVWSDPPGLTFSPETNKNKFTLITATNAAPGPRLVRVYNDDGASEPQFFLVDDSPQLDEKEPNNKFTEPQEIASLPIIVNARLNARDDSDHYRIHLKKGEWLDASLEAYTLMSKFDGVLRVLATNGVTLTWNHDYATFDPRVWWRAPEDQTVIVQVFGFVYPANNDIRLYGGDDGNYRLHLKNSQPLTPALSRGEREKLRLPIEVVGVLTNVGQQDRFEFEAKKDSYVEARVEAAKIGSPLDAWVKITDKDGKELTKQDDTGSRDPRVQWQAPADTNYFIVVGSTLNRASTNYFYRLKASVAPPDFSAVWSAKSLVMTNNSTNTIKFDLKRFRGHASDLTAEFRELPAGVTSSAVNLTNKSGEISMTLTASNAVPFQGPIRLYVTDSAQKAEKLAIVELTSRGEDNGVPNGYSTLAIESYDHVWLTVKPEAPPKDIASTNTAAK